MAKMTVQAFLNKLNLALSSKTYYATGAFGAPMNETMRVRYARNTPFLDTVTADPSRFLFDCCGLIKAVLGGWSANSSATYGGTDVHNLPGHGEALFYGDQDVPDYNETSMFNVCSNISTDFNNIKPGEAVWQTGHIGVYIGDGFCIEATPAFVSGGGVFKSAVGDAHPGYPYRRNGAYKWVKHGMLPWVDYSSSPEPEKPYRYKGIDIASYTGAVDFEQLKGSVDFVLARIWVGKPMTAQATGDYDQRAYANWEGCISNGIPVLPYMTTYAENDADVREEARSIIWWFNNQTLNTPKNIVWIELENQGGGYPRDWSTYTAQQLLDRFKLYKNLLNAAGIEMGILTGMDRYWTERLSDPWYDANVYKWVKSLGQDPAEDVTWNRSFSIWQSSDQGFYPGISNNVKVDQTNDNFWTIDPEPEPPGPGPEPEPTPDPPTPTEEVDELYAQLYSFRDERNVLNKLSGDIVSLWYGRIRPFNLVEALSFTFTLSKYYPSNYCRFKVGGLQYFANVEVRTLANGLYQYICTIDAGTTGYYQGLYNDQYATFLYSPSGKKLWMDERVPREKEALQNRIYFEPENVEDVAVLVICSGSDVYPAANTTQNPAMQTVVLNSVGLSSFRQAIKDHFSGSDAVKYMPSIVKSYCLHNFPFAAMKLEYNPSGNDSIYLYGVPSGGLFEGVTPYSSFEVHERNNATAANDIAHHCFRAISIFSGTNVYASENLEISINRENANAKMHLYIPDCGTIDFKLSDIIDLKNTAENSTVKIGYKIYYDFAGANLVGTLWINNAYKDRYRTIGTASEYFPILYSQNVTNYVSLATSAIGIAAGVAGAIISAKTGNATLAHESGALIGSGAASITKQVSDDIYNSPTSVKGNLGGSPDHASVQDPYLMIEYNREINGAAFSAQFGYPDGETKKIMTTLSAAGYYQTGETDVKAAGYNDSIVDGARRALQEGVKIVV